MDPQLKRLISSYVRVFVAVVLAMFLAEGADVFAVSVGDLRTWLAAGLAAVLPPLIRWLDPSDTAFGRGADQ